MIRKWWNLLTRGFHVQCDEHNNSPEDIEAGRVVVDVTLPAFPWLRAALDHREDVPVIDPETGEQVAVLKDCQVKQPTEEKR